MREIARRVAREAKAMKRAEAIKKALARELTTETHYDDRARQVIAASTRQQVSRIFEGHFHELAMEQHGLKLSYEFMVALDHATARSTM